ncbi:MAG: LptF/LptG family permease [Rhizobiaceae bacterium]
MKVLERYILRRILIQFSGATAASLGIVWIIQALTRINLVTDTGQSISSFLYLSLLILPAIIPIVMPFAVLIATAQTLNTMNTDSELAVVNAAGVPKLMIYKPIMIVAALASLVTVFFGNFVEPYARQTGRVLVAEARADFLSLVIQEGSFKQIEKNVFMQIAERKEGGILSGLFVSDSRDPALDMIYYAREGSVLKQNGVNLLLMRNGEIHRRAVKDGQLSIIRFSSYAYDLSEFTTAGGTPTLLPKDQTTQYLWAPDPNDRTFQKQPLLLNTELHRRLSEWLYPLAFAMIGAGACARVRSHREPAATAMFSAVAAAFVLRWTGIFAEDAAENTQGLAPLVYLVPLLGILIPAAMAMLNKSIEPPKPVTDFAAGFAAKIQSGFDRLRVRLSGFRRHENEARP